MFEKEIVLTFRNLYILMKTEEVPWNIGTLEGWKVWFLKDIIQFSYRVAERRIVKRQFFIFFYIFLFVSMMSCNGTTGTPSFNKAENKTMPNESKKIVDKQNQKLSSMLYQLAVSPDPDSFAKRHDIFLDNHRVRVYIFLDPSAPAAERTKLLKTHRIMIEKGTDDMLRALAPIDQLIPLSDEPGVRHIRLPDKLLKTRIIRP